MSLLRLERVRWSRRDGGGEVLRDVSLDLDGGALSGVHGARGAGKTTLAKVAAGRLAPDGGQVLLDGQPLSGAARRAGGDQGLLARIGFASRHGPPFDDLTAAAWIASALVDAGSWRSARRRAGTAIERVGLGTADALRWTELSDHERVLAGIAQAVVRGPHVLVVDAPVSGMAKEDRRAIVALLRGFANDGLAVLATATEPSELDGFDAVWALDGGRLEGPPPRPAGRVIPLRGRDALPDGSAS